MSQQNDFVEIKYKQILHIVCTLMINIYVASYLWYDAIICTCHMISRMSYSILHDMIFFSYLQ